MPQPSSLQKAAQSGVPAITKENYLSLAGFLEGKERIQRVHKKEPHAEALRKAGEMYGNREYVAAYECVKPLCDKVVTEMQRVLARNLDFEANKLAKEQRKSLAAAKESIQKMKVHAQEVIDRFNSLLKDLESKPLVRAHRVKASTSRPATVPEHENVPPTALNSAAETRLDATTVSPPEVVMGDLRYDKTAYSPPQIGTLYCVRDKSRGERVIRVVGISPDRALVQVETLDDGKPSSRPIQLRVDSLARQAAQGWCSILMPVTQPPAEDEAPKSASQPSESHATSNVIMRLDIQNFGRCCADINRANIRFDTQLIKDVGDGPFRAGNYEHAFLTFEQLAVSFTSAVVSSRQAIAEGRRALAAEKGNLSGKEIQERTVAFIRSEQLIHTAEREFSTILEGLRMYLRAQQG
jgi:hypothetical protein